MKTIPSLLALLLALLITVPAIAAEPTLKFYRLDTSADEFKAGLLAAKPDPEFTPATFDQLIAATRLRDGSRAPISFVWPLFTPEQAKGLLKALGAKANVLKDPPANLTVAPVNDPGIPKGLWLKHAGPPSTEASISPGGAILISAADKDGKEGYRLYIALYE
jgi:hypothetical protein